MKKIYLGKTGIKVSKIGFGVLTVGPLQLNLSIKEGAKALRYALEQGVNFIDTAQYYRTYPYIKEALKGYDGELVIMSKSLDYSYEGMQYAIEECISETGLDKIDIFLLHEVSSKDDFDFRKDAWQCLIEAKEKGLIKAIGISTHHVDVAEFCSEISELDILFSLINIRGMGIRHFENSGSRDGMAAAILKAHENGKGTVAMKVFGGGNLTPSYQESFNYVYNLPGIDSLMVGLAFEQEVDDILKMEDGTLSGDYQPHTLAKKVRVDQGDCVRCYECIDRCPNKAMYVDRRGDVAINYEACLTCGYCSPMCKYLAILLF